MKKIFFQSILRAIESVEMLFCIITMSLTTLLICATVANRYIFHYEIMWLNDLALYIFVFFMFTAVAVTVYKEGHISIDIFYKRAFRGIPGEEPSIKFSWWLYPFLSSVFSFR